MDLVPVQSAYFGNVRDKTQFLIHRQIEPRGYKHVLDRYFRNAEIPLDTTSRLAADFAHDRREMRLVFPDFYDASTFLSLFEHVKNASDSDWPGRQEREHYIFTLLVRYRSIRQILVSYMDEYLPNNGIVWC